MLRPEICRPHFPALATPWALLDNAGGSAPARAVIERVQSYLSHHPVQLGASYPLSVEARGLFGAGRRAAERLVNAEPGEVVLGPSSTVLVRILRDALRPLFEPGDEVVVTNLDHEANVGPWRQLEEHGLRVREWRFDPQTARLELADLEPLLTDRTRLVCFTHVSNVVGTIHDAAAIVRRIHAAGAWACVDGVALAPHRRVDVKALDADFYFLSLYKTYGPHLGLLYGKRELLLRAKSQNHVFVGEDEVPYKLEPGNVSYELAASIPGILEYLAAIESEHAAPSNGTPAHFLESVFDRIAATEEQLQRPLLEFLRDHPRVRVIGSTDPGHAERVPTVAFTVEGLPASAIPPRLEERQVAVRWGHFYAWRAIRDLGLADLDGVVRASLLHYNTADEVERLVSTLAAALR